MPSQLLPAAQEEPRERPIADCRVYERTNCELPATCQPASALEMKEMRWAATIADISLGGVRVILQRRFERGTGLALELPGSAERESNVVFVKVVHVRRQENGMYALGCQFISELSDDEMQRLLRTTNHVLSSTKPQDDRDHKEARGIPEHRELTNVHLLVESTSELTWERQIKRLCVTKCWPLTPGKILSINGKTRGQAPWSARIQVMEYRSRANGCEIRGRIVE